MAQLHEIFLLNYITFQFLKKLKLIKIKIKIYTNRRVWYWIPAKLADHIHHSNKKEARIQCRQDYLLGFLIWGVSGDRVRGYRKHCGYQQLNFNANTSALEQMCKLCVRVN